MPKYRARIPLPELFRSWIETINGSAGVLDLTVNYIEVEFHEKDEYELGQTVYNLRDELFANSWDTDIPRPTLTAEPELCGAYYGVTTEDGKSRTAVCVRLKGHPLIGEDGIGHSESAS